jgi:SPP1 gp7 family putative phage head morphogenesis protein
MPTPPKRSNPVKFKGPEREYVRQLRKIAAHVGDIIRAFPNPADSHKLAAVLSRYSAALDEWAHSTATRMLTAVEKRDLNAWRKLTKQMSLSLRQEIKKAPTGQAMRALLAEQVHLIKSIPTEAAQRVHKLVIEGQSSTRAGDIAKEIMRSGDVAKSRAELIALTETSRAASTLTQARAEHIGSTGYIWRTSKDSHVRDSHKRMEGRFVRWDSPPTLDNLTGHAGCLPRCRCYPEPVIPE